MKSDKEPKPAGLKHGNSTGGRIEQRIVLILCVAVFTAGIVQAVIKHWHNPSGSFATDWIPIAAAIFAAAGILQWKVNPRWHRIQRAFLWFGLLLMIWTANGLPFDLFRLAGLMPPGMDWPGMVTRVLAITAAVMLARIALALPADLASLHPARWYGYAAFVLALPYPVLRICWAFGGTPGIMWPGAAGEGFAPLIIASPWMLAAILSLLLVPDWPRMPRRLLLTAGWIATAIVAMIGPGAFWALITRLISGKDFGLKGMSMWVPALFYSSWFFWAIAAAAATRSYQLRSARFMKNPGA